MKGFPTTLISFFLVAGTMVTSVGSQPPYGWTLSDSTTDPFANAGPFVAGLLELELWFTCSTGDVPGVGMASAQFAVVSDNPANVIVAVTPRNGFVNAGPAPPGNVVNLLLAVGGCPEGANAGQIGHAATVLVVSNAPGSYAFQPFDGVKATIDCSSQPNPWNMQWIGYSSDGSDPQSKEWDNCQPASCHCPILLCLPDGSCIIELTDCDNCDQGVDSCDECNATPVASASWGGTKGRYR